MKNRLIIALYIIFILILLSLSFLLVNFYLEDKIKEDLTKILVAWIINILSIFGLQINEKIKITRKAENTKLFIKNIIKNQTPAIDKMIEIKSSYRKYIEKEKEKFIFNSLIEKYQSDINHISRAVDEGIEFVKKDNELISLLKQEANLLIETRESISRLDSLSKDTFDYFITKIEELKIFFG